MSFEADLDLADALDLDRAIAQGAATLKALGSDRLPQRPPSRLRSATSPAPRPPSICSAKVTALVMGMTGSRSAREVVVHAHFDASTVGEQTVFGPTGRMEEGQRLVLLDQIKDWCGDSRTKVTIKPVIDFNRAVDTGVRDPGPDPRAGRSPRPHLRVPLVHPPRPCCDIDHIIEFDHDAAADGRPQPGPTTTSNLAALCRYHHRLKTHHRRGPTG